MSGLKTAGCYAHGAAAIQSSRACYALPPSCSRLPHLSLHRRNVPVNYDDNQYQTAILTFSLLLYLPNDLREPLFVRLDLLFAPRVAAALRNVLVVVQARLEVRKHVLVLQAKRPPSATGTFTNPPSPHTHTNPKKKQKHEDAH